MFLMRCAFLQQNVMTTIVILSMFCKDSFSNPNFFDRLVGYEINAPRRVTAQHNLCVHIPCTFNVPNYQIIPREARGLWFKGDPLQRNIVARKNGAFDTQGEYPRFFLTGEVWKGDCSLRISDVNYEDDSYYTFRLEAVGVQFSFVDVAPKVTVIELYDTPEISPLPTFIAGERSTLTCTSPGRCSGEAPIITWEGATAGKATVQYTNYNEDGTRTYHSNITFIPTIKDSLEILLCKVTFADSLTSSSEIIQLIVKGAPSKPIPTSETGSEDNTRQVCPSMDYKLIAGIIVGNIVILLLIALGLLCFIKRHMTNTGNIPHERKPQGSESSYQDLKGQSNHIYDKIIRK